MKLSSRTLSITLTLFVLVIFVVYFVFNASKFRPLLNTNLYLLVFIALGDITGIFINGLFTKFILRPFNKYIPILESFYVSLISSVGNFFAPVGAGFGFRAIYLKKKHNFSYSHYISTLAGNYIIVFLVNSLAGLLALYLLRSKSNSQYGVLVTIFSAIFIVSLVLSVVKIPSRVVERQENKYTRAVILNLARVTRGWNHIISHKKLLAQLVGLITLNLLLTIAITWTIIHSLHFAVSFAPLLLFSVLGSLSLFINVTPANLGVKEAIYIFSSGVLGFSTSQILSIALIDRGVLFLTLAFLWLFSSRVRSKGDDSHSEKKRKDSTIQ